MRLRFTIPAARDLESILGYLAKHSPRGESRVKEKIQAALTLIREQPHAGQSTSRRGTRRLVVSSFPYLIFYRIADDEIIVTAVRHGMRRPL